MRYSARIESVGNARRQQLRTARQLRTAQSPNERDARLQQLRTARQLRTAQSPKERDARLQQLRTAREQTIPTESTEERQTRLQQLRSAQQQRIAAETPEEIETRLQQLSTAQQQDCSATGLLPNQQRGERPRLKQLKTAKHFQSVRSVSTSSTESECLRCTRDKHNPKLYSSANNMNPGVVPPQLMVCFYTSATGLAVCIDGNTLDQLPEDGNLTQLRVIAIDSPTMDSPTSTASTSTSSSAPITSTSPEDVILTCNSSLIDEPYDSYCAHLPQLFVPTAMRSMTK